METVNKHKDAVLENEANGGWGWIQFSVLQSILRK